MLRILWNSKSAMMAQQEKLDSISNNIANSETEGYKSEDVNFNDLVYETLQRTGYPYSNGLPNESITGTGVKCSNAVLDTTQGSVQNTGLNTDLCIDGEGLFKVTKSDGTAAYTRGGAFNIDANGNIVDKNGDKLAIDFTNGTNTKFTKDNFTVLGNGEIYVKNSNNENVQVGKIKLYNAVGTNSMVPQGNNLYKPVNGAQVYEVTKPNIKQGWLEMSNVDLTKEMTDMLMTQRAFELGSRGLKTADDMWSMVNNIRGR